MSKKKGRRERVFSLDGDQCLSCGSSQDLEIDHIVPQAADGPDCWNNLQTLCQTCNRRKTDQPIDYRSPERRLAAERNCGCGWQPPLVVRQFGKSSEQRQSIWETCGAVERRTDRLSGEWVFAGTWLPIAELFEELNEGITLDQFLDCYEGIEMSDAERIIDRQIELLRTVRAKTL
nr:HNH endonuclease [bacterium]MDE0501692.1 HNH endonuclease [bacterium]